MGVYEDMREIKFRAFLKARDKRSKDKMIYFNHFNIEESTRNSQGIDYKITFSRDNHGGFLDDYTSGFLDIPIMQFTGLKDKNGKDIYEGDIVRVDYYVFNYEVIFENGCFRLEAKQGLIKTNSIFILHDYFKMKILGNIYENPELLK